MRNVALAARRWRAVSIAVLSIFIFFVGTLLIADGLLWLIILKRNPLPTVSQAETASAFLIGLSILIVTIFVWKQLVISTRRVAKHLKPNGFRVYVKRNRLEAVKDRLQISLFLERTWQAYSPFPRSMLSRDENGKWTVERSDGYDPSYMYQKGILRILRYDTPVSQGIIYEALTRKELKLADDAVYDGDVIINRRVGAWMGKHLLREIDAALIDAGING